MRIWSRFARSPVVLLAVATLMLTGCGGGDDTVTTEPAPPVADPTTGPAASEPTVPEPTSEPTPTTVPPPADPPAAEPPATDPADAPPQAQLTIRLDATGSGDVTTLQLTCQPPGGDHPDPQAACAAIQEAGGPEAFEPPAADLACTQIYGGPQTAAVTGTVSGESVSKVFSRTDGCEIAAWEALAPLLGASGGEL